MKMRKFTAFIAMVLCAVVAAGCVQQPGNSGNGGDKRPPDFINDDPMFAGDETAYGKPLQELGIYDGYFEDAVADVSVTCVSGTAGCYRMEGNTLIFSGIRADSAYVISGKLKGNIVIEVTDSYKFDLELNGFTLVSDTACPIVVNSGDKVDISAKNGSNNYIYDKRQAVAEETGVYSGAIHSKVDLKVSGKGALTVVSENNNGIHSKKDLEVKNLTLTVVCSDNALKGNDTVQITGGNTTLIATCGDGIKTTNSDISSKGNQRGTVSISEGVHTIYAACDGIDAAYDVQITGETTVVHIYTDKYSNYSEQITAVDNQQYYIRFTNQDYRYSVLYYNSDSDFYWVNAEYHSTASGGQTTQYYYSFPKMEGYQKLQVFIYSADMQQSQQEEYLAASERMNLNAQYDTFALSAYGSGLGYRWTNYSTKVQDEGAGASGGPGMNDDNADNSDRSAKGIKAANEILIQGGALSIKSYDDAMHANNDTALENGKTPKGNITVSAGAVNVYSNDDAVHADGLLSVRGGVLNVVNSYEGLEGNAVNISGGSVAVVAADDGVNAMADAAGAFTLSDGYLYIYCGGDGIDSNSRTNYEGIVFAGGRAVIVTTSGMNSAIDSEKGYTYYAGSVLAVMPQQAMISETVHCQDFANVASTADVTLSNGSYISVKTDGKNTLTVKTSVDFAAAVVYLGSNSADISVTATSGAKLDGNGVCWH